MVETGWRGVARGAASSACNVPVTQPGASRPIAGWSRRPKAVARRRSSWRSSGVRTGSGAGAGELRDRFLLRAAREYVRADQIDQASALLKQVSTTLPSADFALRARSPRRSICRLQNPDRALAELDRIPQPLPREDASDLLALRARRCLH